MTTSDGIEGITEESVVFRLPGGKLFVADIYDDGGAAGDIESADMPGFPIRALEMDAEELAGLERVPDAEYRAMCMRQAEALTA